MHINTRQNHGKATFRVATLVSLSLVLLVQTMSLSSDAIVSFFRHASKYGTENGQTEALSFKYKTVLFGTGHYDGESELLSTNGGSESRKRKRMFGEMEREIISRSKNVPELISTMKRLVNSEESENLEDVFTLTKPLNDRKNIEDNGEFWFLYLSQNPFLYKFLYQGHHCLCRSCATLPLH